MSFKMFTVACFTAFCVLELAAEEQGPVPQVCLGCICEAVSGCNTTSGCVGDICGPFHITWAYWADGGKPTLNGEPSSSGNEYFASMSIRECRRKCEETHDLRRQNYYSPFDASEDDEERLLPKVCLRCICEAVSGCNKSAGCTGDICGPFHITWGYWTDGGKPTLNEEPSSSGNAYATCTNDAFCSTRAVQGYMRRYAKDCNGDGVINCDDYARIHYLGPYGCFGTLPPKYENDYNMCKNSFQ